MLGGGGCAAPSTGCARRAFARPGCEFTRDFECLVAWLATRTDKSTVKRLVRIDWDTVGRIIQRVCADELDGDRLDGLFDIGIDEVSWRKQQRYLTLVVDHHRRCVVWGTEGAAAAAADRFFAELDPDVASAPSRPQRLDIPPRSPVPAVCQPEREDAVAKVGERATQLRAISLDMGPGYAKSAREHAPQAIICIDPYHVVQLANKALDEVRRDYWNQLRQIGDQEAAKRFKDARWVLLKRPENLTVQQAATYRELKQAGGDAWRAYTLKEALRAIFAAGPSVDDITLLIDRFTSRAARSRLTPFVRFGQTIRKHRDGILAAIRLGINQGRTEALNNKVRLITRRAYGFHSADGALALVMLHLRTNHPPTPTRTTHATPPPTLTTSIPKEPEKSSAAATRMMRRWRLQMGGHPTRVSKDGAGREARALIEAYAEVCESRSLGYCSICLRRRGRVSAGRS
jgi:transposase